jgi:hypothetical protein
MKRLSFSHEVRMGCSYTYMQSTSEKRIRGVCQQEGFLLWRPLQQLGTVQSEESYFKLGQ